MEFLVKCGEMIMATLTFCLCSIIVAGVYKGIKKGLQ